MTTATAMQELTLAEIVAARSRKDVAIRIYDELGFDSDEGSKVLELIEQDEGELHSKVFQAIAEERVDPVAAARAVLGTEAL